jgi:ArsR family transcriptional regulator, arsenate/arsenite/antimonite-responsive transcriptional repressor
MKADAMVGALDALAHRHRLAAFRLLVAAGPEGLCAGSVAARLKLPPSSLTFHLQQLRRAALVTQRRMGRQLFYAANFAAMNALVSYLTENCCGGAGECAVPVCRPSARDSADRAAGSGRRAA